MSDSPAERARKFQSLFLQRLAGRGAGVAVAAGVSEATISRLKSEHLELFCLVLAHAGMKIVPMEMRCFPEERIDAILHLARAYLSQQKRARELFGDEDPE